MWKLVSVDYDNISKEDTSTEGHASEKRLRKQPLHNGLTELAGATKRSERMHGGF